MKQLVLWPQTLTEMLSVRTVHARAALRTTIAVIVATWLAALGHFKMPYWAGISVIMLNNPFMGGIISRSQLRLIATILGALSGVLLAKIASVSIAIFVSIIFFAITASFYCMATSPYPYLFLLWGITVVLIVTEAAVAPHGLWQFAGWRCVEICIGVGVAWAFNLILIPSKAHQQLQLKTITLLKNTEQILSEIQNLYQQQNDTSAGTLREKIQAMVRELPSHQPLLDFARKESSTPILFMVGAEKLLQQEEMLCSHLFVMVNKFSTHINYQWLWQEETGIPKLFAQLFEQLQLLQRTLRGEVKISPTFVARGAETIAASRAYFTRWNQSLGPKGEAAFEVTAIIVFLEQLAQLQEILTELSQIILSTQQPKNSKKFDIPQLFQITKNSTVIKQSARAGLGAVIAVMIWLYSNWPGGNQGIISSIVIANQKNIYDMGFTAWTRILGCLLGGIMGLLWLHFVTIGLFSEFLGLFVFGWIFSYLAYSPSKYAYTGLQAHFALVLALVNQHSAFAMDPASGRLSGMILGIVVMVFLGFFLWRDDPKKMLQQGIQDNFSQLTKILTHWQQGQSSNELQALSYKLSATFAKQQTLITSLQRFKPLARRERLLKKILAYQQQMLFILLSLFTTTNFPAVIQLAQLLKMDITLLTSSVNLWLQQFAQFNFRADEKTTIPNFETLHLLCLNDLSLYRSHPMRAQLERSERVNYVNFLHQMSSLILTLRKITVVAKHLSIDNNPAIGM